ncbi:hypothetical protein SYK_13910 [Pseudodesulfovibrio nedwellii]|uniref:DUF1573 domain-containing protein n=1 Tax=Pseudodesulfovibrio nedwellii TaxID=2973072 RepID=A0ABM8AZW7_9BACT|nr:hypothetical protein SYK_13910 [Pseudodesulfovibrio nedwellii]
MVISYNTFKYPGKFDKTVTVSTGEGKESQQTIHIVGYVDPIPMGVMVVTPRKTTVEGLVNGKATPTKIMIKNSGDASMTVTAVKSRKFKTTYWQGALKLEAGQTAPIEFLVTPNKLGRFMDIIMVYSDARNDIGKGYKAVLIGETK